VQLAEGLGLWCGAVARSCPTRSVSLRRENRRGVELRIRELERKELGDIWSIDRAEEIGAIYHHQANALVLVPEHHDVRGWPPGEPEHYGPILLDCFDRGGTFYGAFDGEVLIGASALESRFIGRERDQLQLKFLHVSRVNRKLGAGSALFEKTISRARELGAIGLYISATPSENTIRFYLRRGCRVADEVDAALFELEPEDIHLELAIGPGTSAKGGQP
jgi:predicted N-acetyltransferase YhbS